MPDTTNPITPRHLRRSKNTPHVPAPICFRTMPRFVEIPLHSPDHKRPDPAYGGNGGVGAEGDGATEGCGEDVEDSFDIVG